MLCADASAGVTFTPSDNFGNTWISIAGPTSTAQGSDLRTQIWYAPNAIVGPNHVITVTLSNRRAPGHVGHRREGLEHILSD